MDKFTETYLNIIAEEDGKGPLIVNDDINDEQEERFLLKVGEKFAGSPPTRLTNNPNMAGVLQSKAIAQNVINYYKSMHYTDDQIELIPWEERGKYI